MIELNKFFAYQQVRARKIDLQELDGKPIEPDTMVYPVAENLPMDCPCSLFFAQSANARQLAISLSGQRPEVMSDQGLPLVFCPASDEISGQLRLRRQPWPSL